MWAVIPGDKCGPGQVLTKVQRRPRWSGWQDGVPPPPGAPSSVRTDGVDTKLGLFIIAYKH